MSHVYVVEMNDRHVKIGMSSKPTDRINRLAHQSGVIPKRVWISDACRNPHQIEGLAHKAFSENRLCRGEYFSIDFDVAKTVTSELFSSHAIECISEQKNTEQKAKQKAKQMIDKMLGIFFPKPIVEEKQIVFESATTPTEHTDFNNVMSLLSGRNLKGCELMANHHGRVQTALSWACEHDDYGMGVDEFADLEVIDSQLSSGELVRYCAINYSSVYDGRYAYEAVCFASNP